MTSPGVDSIGIIAGKGAYPHVLAVSAKQQGVKRIHAVAFRGETDRVIQKVADQVDWIYLGQLGAMLESLKKSGVRKAVMAGQVLTETDTCWSWRFEACPTNHFCYSSITISV